MNIERSNRLKFDALTDAVIAETAWDRARAENIVRIAAYLAECAEQERLVTYGEVATKFGVNKQRSDWINAIYNAIVQPNELPDITILIVSASDRKYPSRGAFNDAGLLRISGRPKADVPKIQQECFDFQHFDRTFGGSS